MTTKVFLDNEEVQLIGPKPKTLYDLLYFLTEHLQQSQRTVQKLLINHQPFEHENQLQQPFSRFENIEIFSTPITQTAEETLKTELQRFSTTLESVSKRIFKSDFEQILEQSKTLIEASQPLLGAIENLKTLSSESSCYVKADKWLQDFNQLLDKWLKNIEKRHIAPLNELIERGFSALLRNINLSV